MKLAKLPIGILALLTMLAGCGGGGGGGSAPPIDNSGGSSNPPIDNNVAPVARFVWTSNPTGGANSFSFDASTSTDADGSIASYSWEFGDGGTATGATATHTYAASGQYLVTLRVTDNSGGRATATSTVDASSQPPVARFTISRAFTNSRTITLDASTSTDPNNDIATYTWKFGDGAPGSGKTVTRDYRNPDPGGQLEFSVELTVTDSQGQSSVTTQTVTITPIRILPLGDSITQGDNTDDASSFAYRVALWKKLLDAKVAFEFVGSQSDNFKCNANFGNYTSGNEVYAFNNMRHEGHWGWRADEVISGRAELNVCDPSLAATNKLADWWNDYPNKPDVVLIMLGTNDLIQGSTASTAANRVQNVVNTLVAKSPRPRILVANIIPIDPASPLNQTAAATASPKVINFNSSLNGQIIDLGLATVQSVDQHSNFNATTGDDTYDGIHPNFEGEDKIATKWFNELKAIYGF